MNADFFNEDKRRRVHNPTFISGNVFSAFIYPNDTRPPIRMENPALNPPSPRKNAAEVLGSPLKINPENGEDNKKSSRRSQSNLSSYGSNSLHTLKYPPGLSDRQIHYAQQKKYDIIGLYPYEKVESSPRPETKLRGQEKEILASSPVSSEKYKLGRPAFDPNGYNGMSTSEQNMMKERQQRVKYRPFYLNNADQIYL